MAISSPYILCSFNFRNKGIINLDILYFESFSEFQEAAFLPSLEMNSSRPLRGNPKHDKASFWHVLSISWTSSYSYFSSSPQLSNSQSVLHLHALDLCEQLAMPTVHTTHIQTARERTRDYVIPHF